MVYVRGHAFDYDRWRADEVWDGDKWSVPTEAQDRPYTSLGATPELATLQSLYEGGRRANLADRHPVDPNARAPPLARRAFAEPLAQPDKVPPPPR